MKNLIFQYYIPYENFDADMGGAEMPDWPHAGMRSTQKYAQICGSEYELSHDRFLKHLDPRLTLSVYFMMNTLTSSTKYFVLIWTC